MSEYGASSPDQITWQWTPAQVLVMAEAIRRRRALDEAQRLHAAYLTGTAAQGSKKAFSALQSTLRRLHKEAGVVKRTDPEELARSLGLTDRRKK
jgi:hypothetical protein